MKNPRIEFTPDEVEECREFAKQVVPTTGYYMDRGQDDKRKWVQDNCESKLGELAVYRYLHDRGFTLDRPDFRIFQPGDKSWSPDLTLWFSPKQRMGLHVKAQNNRSEESFGMSWTFSYAEGDVDPLFSPENYKGLIVPVSIYKVYDRYVGGVIRGAVRPGDVMPEIASERGLPKKKELESYKRVLYGDYLKSLSEGTRWRHPFDAETLAINS